MWTSSKTICKKKMFYCSNTNTAHVQKDHNEKEKIKWNVEITLYERVQVLWTLILKFLLITITIIELPNSSLAVELISLSKVQVQ